MGYNWDIWRRGHSRIYAIEDNGSISSKPTIQISHPSILASHKSDNEGILIKKNSEKILKVITNHYLESRDYNGISLENLQNKIGITPNELIPELISLIQNGKISINFGDRHPNPHIKALEPESITEQIDKLDKCDYQQTCAYPEKLHLKKVVNVRDYDGRPFTLRLALGEPQLSFSSFDLSVLETYRNDPRYSYTTDDIHGRISIHDEYYKSEDMPESDKVLLQSFGFSYDNSLKRAVAVFLIYLSKLSPEHQQIWNAKLLKGAFFLHPEYVLSSSGHFPENESIFTAFIKELQIINDMCIAMGKPRLFRVDYKDKGKPRGFAFLIRPTAKEFQDFVLILDKMMSDNLNKDFFKGEVPLEIEECRADGKIQVGLKGTITLLDEFLKKRVHLNDPEPMNTIIKGFKNVRELRQRPAHALDDNDFDQKYIKQQQELIEEAYSSIRYLRLIFAMHKKCKKIDIPEWLCQGKIISY